jgi:hypothetical protein
MTYWGFSGCRNALWYVFVALNQGQRDVARTGCMRREAMLTGSEENKVVPALGMFMT